IKTYGRQIEVNETGTVLSSGDGIARVYGLSNVMAGELVELPHDLMGLILNLEEDNVGDTVMGEGQEIREGDVVKRTGRIAEVAIETISNRKGQGVFCIYVAIGQKQSTVAQVVDKLQKFGSMEYTTVVAANAADPAPLQFLAPYSGVTIAEFFRDHGQHALMI